MRCLCLFAAITRFSLFAGRNAVSLSSFGGEGEAPAHQGGRVGQSARRIHSSNPAEPEIRRSKVEGRNPKPEGGRGSFADGDSFRAAHLTAETRRARRGKPSPASFLCAAIAKVVRKLRGILAPPRKTESWRDRTINRRFIQRRLWWTPALIRFWFPMILSVFHLVVAPPRKALRVPAVRYPLESSSQLANNLDLCFALLVPFRGYYRDLAVRRPQRGFPLLPRGGEGEAAAHQAGG